MNQHDIQPIDMVVVNLYPFARNRGAPRLLAEDAVEKMISAA